MKKLLCIICSLCIALLSSCKDSTLKQTSANSQKRILAFKEMTVSFKIIKDILNGNQPYNPEEFQKIADNFYQNSKIPFNYMIDDGPNNNGRSKQEIWTNPKEFNLEKTNFFNVVEDFNKNAKIADLNKIKLSVNQLQNSCKSCHSKFRIKK